MAYRTVTDDDLLDRALDLFRTYGFEGVSLSQLSEAIGLEKASLYHRYPRGKDEIVLAVVARVAIVAEQLRVFYSDGTKPCITDVLSISGGSDELRTTLRIALQAWLKAFAEIAKESGLSASLSRLRAEEAIVRIEGSLVVARVLGDSQPFQRVIKFLPDMLTGP